MRRKVKVGMDEYGCASVNALTTHTLYSRKKGDTKLMAD